MRLTPEDGSTEVSVANAKKLVAEYNRPARVHLYSAGDETLVETRWTGTSLLDRSWLFEGFSWGYGGTGPHGLAQFFRMIGLPDFTVQKISALVRDNLDLEVDLTACKPVTFPVNSELYEDFLKEICGKCDAERTCQNSLGGESVDHEHVVHCYGEYLLNGLGSHYYWMYKNWNGNHLSSRIQEQHMAKVYLFILEIEKLRRGFGFGFEPAKFNKKYAHLDFDPPIDPMVFIEIDKQGHDNWFYMFDLASRRYIAVPEDKNASMLSVEKEPHKPLAVIRRTDGEPIPEMPETASELMKDLFG